MVIYIPICLHQAKVHMKVLPQLYHVCVCVCVCVSRTTFERGVFQGEIQLLKPVNLDLSIKRNLASSWYHLIPDIEIKAHLKPMNVSVRAVW